MLPDNVLSTEVISGPFLSPRDAPPSDLIDYDNGGVAIGDTSQGLMVKKWRGEYRDNGIWYDAIATVPTMVHSIDKVTAISITFDQNMRPCFAYVREGVCSWRWYDPVISDYTISNLPAGSSTPKIVLDDKRDFNLANSDIILAYVRSGNLYYLQQRDRFGIERLLKEGVSSLRRIGMNTKYRMQFEIGH